MPELLYPTSGEQVPFFGKKLINKTDVVAALLSIEGGFVVTMLDSKSNVTISDNQFFASFPIKITDKEFTIIISGNICLAKNNENLGREHPFNKARSKGFIPGEIIRGDVSSEYMNFSLIGADNRIVTMSALGWGQLRNRIPATHPLSLIPQR